MKNNTIRTLLSVALLSTVFAQPILAKEVRWVDRIVVIVNQDIITERDITDLMGSLKATMPKDQAVNDETLRQAAIEQLIDKKLVLQTAKRMNITATNAEIQSQIEQIAQSQNMSVEKLYQVVAKEGVKKDALHKTIAENIAIEKTTAQYMADVKVTDSDVQQFLAQNNFPTELPQYAVSHILIKTDDKKNDDAVRKQLLNIRGKLSQGVSFADLARQYSHDASSANGGNIGWVSQGLSSPAFDKALSGLQKGEVSPPIKSEFGWHLIQLNDQRMAAIPPEQRVAIAKNIIAQQKAPMAYQGWLQQMRSAAYIDFRKKPY
ncbi:MAG: peptidylprolyl isomerase [Neisseriaceae bacterium]|nr:peptidylprolyl isomerase [Neisseriaceae bacterium]